MSLLGFPLAGALGGGAAEDGLGGLDLSLNNVSKLLSAICVSGVQPIEQCLQQLLTQRSLDTAIGAQLDVIGKLVGQARGGLDDDTYRRFCRATISAHRSKGTAEDLIKVLDLVIFDDSAHHVVATEDFATVRVRIEEISVATSLAGTTFTFLAKTAAAGIRVILEYGPSLPALWFRYDSGPGFDQGHLIGGIDHV